jgi:hypothetical protein
MPAFAGYIRSLGLRTGLRLPDGVAVLHRDATDDRLRHALHQPVLPSCDRSRHGAVVFRHHHTGPDDRTGVCQAVATEEARPDADVQQARRRVSARRTALPAVPGRRHAQVAHRRGAGQLLLLSLDYVSASETVNSTTGRCEKERCKSADVWAADAAP